MRRVLALLLAAPLIAACGGYAIHVPRPRAPNNPGLNSRRAAPVGCMGPCLPRLHLGAPPATRGLPTLPDVSEWQPCVDRRHAATFRLAYGLRQDARALCNGTRLRRFGVWRAGYSYLLPGACAAQGRRAAAIARSVGGVDLIVADGEERLAPGCIAAFRREAHRFARVPTATYTGCFSGLERQPPLWIPSYGSRPACGPYVAWQFSDGSYCGEGYVTDCSADVGLTRLRPVPTCGSRCRGRRILRQRIVRAERTIRWARANEHADLLRIRRATNDRRHLLSLIGRTERRIAAWRHAL